MKPVQPDDTLAKIVGSKPLPRSEVTKKIWDYIKKNKLQDAKKKTLSNADDALKAVFGGRKQSYHVRDDESIRVGNVGNAIYAWGGGIWQVLADGKSNWRTQRKASSALQR